MSRPSSLEVVHSTPGSLHRISQYKSQLVDKNVEPSMQYMLAWFNVQRNSTVQNTGFLFTSASSTPFVGHLSLNSRRTTNLVLLEQIVVKFLRKFAVSKFIISTMALSKCRAQVWVQLFTWYMYVALRGNLVRWKRPICAPTAHGSTGHCSSGHGWTRCHWCVKSSE